jgi:cathepsin L
VILIGWDNKKQAWLIKNSWGEDWGEKGYAWVLYGSNRIGAWSTWAKAPHKSSPPSATIIMQMNKLLALVPER